MSIVVDTFVMGPYRSNCYVVRGERGAAEAVVVDPGDDPTPLRLELARMGARTAGILVTHTDVDHIGGRRGARRGHGQPRSGRRPARSRRCAPERPAAGCASAPHDPAHTVTGGDEVTVGGHHVRGARRAGPLGRPRRVPRRRPALLGRPALRGLRRPGRSRRRRLGHAARLGAVAARAASRRHRRLSGARTGDDARARSCRRTRSCASCAQRSRELEVPGAARDARRPAAATQRGGTSSGR